MRALGGFLVVTFSTGLWRRVRNWVYTLPMKLTDRVALITGAASGIGWACAQRFLEEGAIVVACDIDRAGLEQLAAKSDQSCLHTAVCDVTRRADANTRGLPACVRFGTIQMSWPANLANP